MGEVVPARYLADPTSPMPEHKGFKLDEVPVVAYLCDYLFPLVMISGITLTRHVGTNWCLIITDWLKA